MAVDLISTPGAANANSYRSLAEFTAYLNTRLRTTTLTADADERARALIMATRDAEELVAWDEAMVGPRKDATTPQALRFPAVAVLTRWRDGVYPDDIVPDFAGDFVFEQAIAHLQKDRTADPATRGIESLGLGKGALDVAFDPMGAAQVRQPIADAAWQKITPWVVNAPATSPSSLRSVELERV